MEPSTKPSAAIRSTRINIGIIDEDRASIAAGLSHLLADTYTLCLTTHNFHWNVTGPMFNTLHMMFMSWHAPPESYSRSPTRPAMSPRPIC